MTEQEIFDTVERINAEIREAIIKFPLSTRAQELVEELEKVQDACPHKFKNGICEICGAFERNYECDDNHTQAN